MPYAVKENLIFLFWVLGDRVFVEKKLLWQKAIMIFNVFVPMRSHFPFKMNLKTLEKRI